MRTARRQQHPHNRCRDRLIIPTPRQIIEPNGFRMGARLVGRWCDIIILFRVSLGVDWRSARHPQNALRGRYWRFGDRRLKFFFRDTGKLLPARSLVI